MELKYNNPDTPPRDGNEYFPVIDESGNVLRYETRKICHSGVKLLHPVVHLQVFNSKGDLYLQKRSMDKDIQPGKWDTAVGGHIDYGESVFQALCREAREELGIKIKDRSEVRFLFSYIFESEIEKEMVNTFSVIYDGEIKPDAGEISEGRFMSIDEIKEKTGKGFFTPNFENESGMLNL